MGHTIRCFGGWLCLLGALAVPNLFAQPVPGAFRTSNRWLLIVETTRAMQPRAEASAQIAGNLLLSGMNGQMRSGDTIGLWTFNDRLHAGDFSLQTWTPENAKELAGRVALFVTRQKFENRVGRNPVFSVMNTVISNSEFITVVLITSGNETMSGTPFDKAINSIHQQWQTQQEKARQPFLTMLRAQAGRITDFEVGRPPGPLEFPPLPAELMITNPASVIQPIAKTTNAPPPPPAPNLIVHGKKREPEPEIVSNPPPPILLTNVAKVADPKWTAPTQAVAPAINVATVANSPALTNNLATAAAVDRSAQSRTFWIASAIALLAAAGLVAVIFRRGRSEPRVSLITRSLDRDKK